MSLDFKLTNIKNFKELCYLTQTHNDTEPVPEGWYKPKDKIGVVEQMNPVTSALIWSMISIDLGSITAGNVNDFYARIACVEKLFSPMLRDGTGYRCITLQDVKDHIGLSANVADESWTHFAFRQMHNLRAEVLRKAGVENTTGSHRDMPASVKVEMTLEAIQTLLETVDEKMDEPLFSDNVALGALADALENTTQGLKLARKSFEKVERMEAQQWDRLAEASHAEG